MSKKTSEKTVQGTNSQTTEKQDLNSYLEELAKFNKDSYNKLTNVEKRPLIKKSLFCQKELQNEADKIKEVIDIEVSRLKAKKESYKAYRSTKRALANIFGELKTPTKKDFILQELNKGFTPIKSIIEKTLQIWGFDYVATLTTVSDYIGADKTPIEKRKLSKLGYILETKIEENKNGRKTVYLRLLEDQTISLNLFELEEYQEQSNIEEERYIDNL